MLNLGFGWYNHKNASLVKSATDSIYQDQTALGLDLFLDMPLNKEKGTALSVLATVYSLHYGKNYIRNIGILNEHTTPVSTSESFAGGGNTQPTIGTGTIGYLQAGFVLPKLKMELFYAISDSNLQRFSTIKRSEFSMGAWFELSYYRS